MRFIIILIPILISAIAQIVLKIGIGSATISGRLADYFIKTLTTPLVLLGLGLYGLGALLWLVVLSREDVRFAFPLVSLAYIIAIFLSAIFLKEQVNWARVIGPALIMAGIFVIALFGQ